MSKFIGRTTCLPDFLDAIGAKHVQGTSYRLLARSDVPSGPSDVLGLVRGLQRWLGIAAKRRGNLGHSTHQRTASAYQNACLPSAGWHSGYRLSPVMARANPSGRINPLYLCGMPSPPHLVVTRFRYRHPQHPPKTASSNHHASSLQTLACLSPQITPGLVRASVSSTPGSTVLEPLHSR